MSEAILTFQVQLSGVMETVLKSAMYEITRLVEDSFLEEVARSKQEVESLRQRLQWWESRRREREGGGRARCADCGRAGVPREGAHATAPPAPPAEGRGLKQERVLGGDWSSCAGEASNPGPLGAPEEAATPSPVGVPEMHTAAPVDLEGGGSDPLLKEEEPQESRSGGDVQGKWRLGPDGAEGDSAGHLRVRQDTAPPAGQRPTEQQGRQRAGETCGFYAAGSEHCAGSGDHLDSEDDVNERDHPAGADFTQGSSDSERRSAHAKLQSDSDGLSPARSLDVKPLSAFPDTVTIKQEVEALPEWGEQTTSTGVHTQHRQRRKNRARAESHAGGAADLSSPVNPPGECSMVEDLTLQPRLQQCSSSGKHTQIRPSDRTAVTHSSSASDKGAYTSYSRGLMISKNIHNHQRVCTVERKLSSIHFGRGITQLINVKSLQRQQTEKASHSCTQCGKTFSHFCHLKAHQQTHTGERPFCCTLCGRSFTKLSNLKAHRRVHTGERPYMCTECGKRFTQKCNLKRHQRIHTAERLFSCK
ncbi:hypothetical protein MATL_G00220570 [Megalops atlanticus]|uniref:C2H2-type domain-containing protein n=1 Tax=Megalops atlanticus TaxID=7932 RepID=A0A9D3T2V2_MEGAT|nr:hypothetical protein MATL_G00220570 [Megalops atlanticus]